MEIPWKRKAFIGRKNRWSIENLNSTLKLRQVEFNPTKKVWN